MRNRPEMGRKGEKRRREGGGRAVAHGLDSAQQGREKGFLFFFLFSNSYFHFCIFFS
jgi:hypothetical protein